MVYSSEAQPSRGQGFRDMVRCEALEDQGYEVNTIDNKHDTSLGREGETLEDLFPLLTYLFFLGKHCRANFSDVKRMSKAMSEIWGSRSYDIIALDYFFSPAGWVNTRWSENFFGETLPGFLVNKILKDEGSLWLPNLEYVRAMLQKYQEIISQFYTWSVIKDPNENPLYEATNFVEKKLMECPDHLTNGTQILPLSKAVGGPFICLKVAK